MSRIQSYAGLMGRQLPMFNPFMQGLRLWGGGGMGQPVGGGQAMGKPQNPLLNGGPGPGPGYPPDAYGMPYANPYAGGGNPYSDPYQSAPKPPRGGQPPAMAQPALPKDQSPYLQNLFMGGGLQQMSQAPSASPMMGDTRYAPGYGAQNTPSGPVDYRQFAQAPAGAGKAMADMAPQVGQQPMGQPMGGGYNFGTNQMGTGYNNAGVQGGGYGSLAQGPTAPMGGWNAQGPGSQNFYGQAGVGNTFGNGAMPGYAAGAPGPEPYNQSAYFPGSPLQSMAGMGSGAGMGAAYQNPSANLYQQQMQQQQTRGGQQPYTIYG